MWQDLQKFSTFSTSLQHLWNKLTAECHVKTPFSLPHLFLTVICSQGIDSRLWAESGWQSLAILLSGEHCLLGLLLKSFVLLLLTFFARLSGADLFFFPPHLSLKRIPWYLVSIFLCNQFWLWFCFNDKSLPTFRCLTLFCLHYFS